MELPKVGGVPAGVRGHHAGAVGRGEPPKHVTVLHGVVVGVVGVVVVVVVVGAREVDGHGGRGDHVGWGIRHRHGISRTLELREAAATSHTAAAAVVLRPRPGVTTLGPCPPIASTTTSNSRSRSRAVAGVVGVGAWMEAHGPHVSERLAAFAGRVVGVGWWCWC